MNEEIKERLQEVKSEARRIMDCMGMMVERGETDRDLLYLMANKAQKIARMIDQIPR